jgi:glycosyltransferase involved in cell wall biosynthesis
LQCQDVQVTVWTTDVLDGTRRSGEPRDRVSEGVRILTSRNLSNDLAYKHQLFLPRKPWIGDLAGVDIVHLHGHRHLLNNVAVDAARAWGVPYVMTPNGTLPRHERKIGAKWVWDLAVSGRIPAGAAKMIAVSKPEIGHFRSAGIALDRIVRIPNGLMLDEFADLPEPGTFKARWKIPRRKRLVAYLGQVSPRKGVDHLVNAFRDSALRDATLVVAGNDMGGMDKARALADKSVVFTGLLAGRERLRLLVDADVLVYASTDEIFGLVPFEGLMCGTPVVVGGDCGCGQLIGEAGAGLLVRHADVEGLRLRIRTLLDDPVAAGAMVTRGRRYVMEHLSFEVTAAQHKRLYEELLQ